MYPQRDRQATEALDTAASPCSSSLQRFPSSARKGAVWETHQNSPTDAGSHFSRAGTPGIDSSMPLKVPVEPQKWLGE